MDEKQDLKQAMITVLKAGLGLDTRHLLSVYPETDGHYVVDYLWFEGEAIPAGLSIEQKIRLKKEEEMSEFFDSPEDAVEFFLKLKGKNESQNLQSQSSSNATYRKPEEV